jgi:hypothetical protein
MARPGFFNDNINRDYPFLHDWFDGHKVVDTDPESPTYKECIETQTNGPLPGWRVKDLPDYAVADFGCVMGVESGYVEGIHSVWLQQVRRKASTISYEFHSDAPGLNGRALIFDRDITASDFVTEMVKDVVATDEALYGWPPCDNTQYPLDCEPNVSSCGHVATEMPKAEQGKIVAACSGHSGPSVGVDCGACDDSCILVDWHTPFPNQAGFIAELWDVTNNTLVRKSGVEGPCESVSDWYQTSCCNGVNPGTTQQLLYGPWAISDCNSYKLKLWFYDGAKAQCDGTMIFHGESNIFSCCGEAVADSSDPILPGAGGEVPDVTVIPPETPNATPLGCCWCFDQEGQLDIITDTHPWTSVFPWHINFKFEDSKNCVTTGNPDVQCGYASKCFTLSEDTTIKIKLDGEIEKQNPGFDMVKVIIKDGEGKRVAILEDLSDAFGGACEMVVRSSSREFTLPPGDYEIEVFISSIDGRYHRTAYWNIEIEGLDESNEASPCCGCNPPNPLPGCSSTAMEPEPECPCEPCGHIDPDCSATSPPLWEGYMVSGSIDRLAEVLADCQIIQGRIPVEPALMQSLAGGHVQSVSVANAERTKATSAEGCREICFEGQECETDCMACGCLSGDVYFKEGYNSVIAEDELTNTLIFSASVGSGEGEPCSEVPICDSEKNMLANTPGITTLSGASTCGEVVMSINGVGGKYFHIEGSNGVEVTPYPEFNRIIVDVNLQDLALCKIAETTECATCPPYSTDPCDCGPAIIATTTDTICGDEKGACSYDVVCVSSLWSDLKPGINATVETKYNDGPIILSWGFKSDGKKEKLTFKGSAPPTATVKFDTDYTLGQLAYTYVNTTDYPLTGVTLKLDLTIGVSNKVISTHNLPLEIAEGVISLNKDVPYTIKSKAGLELVIVGFKSDATTSKSFTVAEGTTKSVDLVVQFKQQNECCHPSTDPLYSTCCKPTPCVESS